jgi:hypothetical protein
MRLDDREEFPTGLEKYLSTYGWHFSKRLCNFAVSHMKKDNGERITPITKEALDILLAKNGIELDNKFGYDYVFVANMCKADYLGSSVPDEAHLAKFVKDYCDDPDGYSELPFTRFYADTIGKGVPIIWEDML